MHPALGRVAKVTQGTPYQGRLYLVGGAVRDALLGVAGGSDFDIVYEGNVEPLTQLLFESGIASGPPTTYVRFGTSMIRVEGVNLEFAQARSESYAEESRKPFVVAASLAEDALRRDFTVNALMQNLHTGEILDLLGDGVSDLQAKILRTPREPAQTFSDDPLRMLRAIRFVGKLGFTPAPGLYEAIRAEAPRLKIISMERVQEELVKMLRLPAASTCLADLLDLGLLDQVAAEFRAMQGVEQGKYHHLDVWEHTLLVVKNAGHEDLILTLGALLHDVGKPGTRSVDEHGNTRFFHHESVGADMSEVILTRLKFSTETVRRVHRLVKNHMRLGSSPRFTPSAARRLTRDMEDDLPLLLDLVQADVNSLRPGVITMDLDAIRQQISAVQAQTPRETLQSPLTGEEIMLILNLPAGPEVGAAKSFLTEQVLEGVLAPDDRANAEVLLRQIWPLPLRERGPRVHPGDDGPLS